MRFFQRTVVILFVIVALLFVGMLIYEKYLVDDVPPVILCEEDTIRISVEDGEDALLEGVTARDDVDGDLTDKVMVKSVSPLIDTDTAKVTYFVFDSSDNVATASRMVQYRDYERPRFSLREPLIYRVGSTVTLLDRLTATDEIDGDISDRIRVTAQNLSVDYAGTYSVTVQVTNSLGDTAILPLHVVMDSYGAVSRLVDLTEYIVYVDEGEDFDPLDYVKRVRDYDYTVMDVSNLAIESNVDTSVPGNYEVSYTFVSSSVRAQTYTAWLAVVVE